MPMSTQLGTLTAADFHPGENVRYVPNHAHGDIEHKDCENGVVSSQNGLYVFVRYSDRHGDLKFTTQATDPYDLIKL